MSTSRWLTPSKRSVDARSRLFCFPYAGGGASVYRAWPAAIPETVDVRAVQLPGRESRLREAPHVAIGPLAGAAAEALEPATDLPYAIFGHSMGALVGFEVARRLTRPPALLVVSGHRAPHLPLEMAPVADLPDDELMREIERLNGMPREVLEHDELRELLVPILRADFRLCETYTLAAGPPLPCPIVAYGGLDDPEVSREALDGWREHTSAGFVMRLFPGDHFFVVEQAPLVLRALVRDLAGAVPV